MLKTQLADLGLPAGCHWQSSHPLKERIAMLKQPLPGRTRRWIGTACVAVIVAATSFAAWAAQPGAPANATPKSVLATPASAPATVVSPRITGVSYRRMTRIDYPQSAIAAKAQAVVYIAVHVGTDGKVADAKVSSVMPMARTDLADAALTAVKSWTFEPRMVDGKATTSDTTVAIAFSLDSNKPLTVVSGVLDAIRVSPPAADSASSEDKSVTENTEFRIMHPPKYPVAAIEAHEQGKIMLKVHVDARGLPLEANVIKAEPENVAATFGNPSIAAVMQWQFNPARKHGKAIDGWVLVPFTFSLTEL
jgi:TonB family protein